jgi:hypothetical protein
MKLDSRLGNPDNSPKTLWCTHTQTRILVVQPNSRTAYCERSTTQYCDMTPESRNSPLLDNGSLTYVLWRCGFMHTDLVRNAISMSTESTNNSHGYALDYIRSKAEKELFVNYGRGPEGLGPENECAGDGHQQL